MRVYEKPVLEIIELRPEERLAGNSITVKDVSIDGWHYTIKDSDFNGAGDFTVTYAEAWNDRTGHYKGSPNGLSGKLFKDFLKTMGLAPGNWWWKK